MEDCLRLESQIKKKIRQKKTAEQALHALYQGP